MDDITTPTLPDDVIDAIAHGDHADPFSVLGMHQVDGNLIVRAFLPRILRVSVLDVKKRTRFWYALDFRREEQKKQGVVFFP